MQVSVDVTAAKKCECYEIQASNIHYGKRHLIDR